eukprot:CAMPEP_0202400268 /NCGR_PEP_ID=MMETSP1128-20130828/2602_1 /ASSEMBLY_ACC=CAM_ASM_000463 /TAXON_ID=3047 /ORGANISM="Dunaliella tertiolecta, Strain CCMP1320" /LENGTH=331 /DNA_ID=CAMNT_0049003775 /DNA_START=254 /DNA_END=1246 /DNA_ORIENTATION=-
MGQQEGGGHCITAGNETGAPSTSVEQFFADPKLWRATGRRQVTGLNAPAHLYTPPPPPPPSQLATQFKALQALALGLDLAPFIVPPSARQAPSHAVAHAVRAASGAAGGGKHGHNHHQSSNNNNHHSQQPGHNHAHHAVLHPPSHSPSMELPCPPLGSSQQQQQPPFVPLPPPPPPQPPIRQAGSHPVSSSHTHNPAHTPGSTKRAFSSMLPHGCASTAAAAAASEADGWVDDNVQGTPELHILAGAPKRRRTLASKRARCASQVSMHTTLLLNAGSPLPPAPPPPSLQQQPDASVPHHDVEEELAAAAATAAAAAIASSPLATSPPSSIF